MYAIEGDLSSGKSTLGAYMFWHGFNILPELARWKIEKEMRKKSEIVPWKKRFELQEQLAKLQLRVEAKAAKRFGADDIVFVERGLLTGFGYCEPYDMEIPPTLRLNADKCTYRKMYFLQALARYTNDMVRIEPQEESIMISAHIIKGYADRNIDPVFVPSMSDSMDESLSLRMHLIVNDVMKDLGRKPIDRITYK